jgi:hypothetical protein
MDSRILLNVRSAARNMKRSTTYWLLAFMQGSSGAAFCVPSVGNGSRQLQVPHFRHGGWMLGGRSLKSCGRGSTRQCCSCPSVCGEDVTVVSSTMWQPLWLKRDGGTKEMSGPLRASRQSRRFWWREQCAHRASLHLDVAKLSEMSSNMSCSM